MDTRSQYILRNESFEINSPEIRVETVSGDVNIVESMDEKSYVEISGKSEGGKALEDLIDISSNGKKIMVRVGRRNGGLRQIFSGHSHDLNILLRLPKSSIVKIKAVSADVKVDHSVQNLEVNSVSGDISVLQNPTVTCKLNSVSGDITARTFSACNYSLKSVSGDITVYVAPGLEIDVDGRSVSGKMASEISLNAIEGSSTADSQAVIISANTVSGDFALVRN